MATVMIEERDAAIGRLSSLSSSWKDNTMRILPNEIIFLGDDDGEGTFNPFAKMALKKAKISGIGLQISNRPLERLSIVSTLWTDGKIIPARVLKADLGCELELADKPKSGERCFVIDKQGSRLITISMESGDNEFVRVVNPNSFISWLAANRSNAVLGDGRFNVSRSGESFEIRDSKKARKYIGKLIHSDDILAGYEVSAIQKMLAAKGLGAILPIYNMEIHTV